MAIVDAGFTLPLRTYSLDQPELSLHGHYATNVALTLSKDANVSPKDCAQKLIESLVIKNHKEIAKVELAGPGFINIFLSNGAIEEYVSEYQDNFEVFPARNESVLCEYTDPNCFKSFHVGHLMANTIGEAVSRLYAMAGYEVTRVCYPSDIGRNVAMGVWGVMQRKDQIPDGSVSLREKALFLGDCYADANKSFETSEQAKEDIIKVNQAIYAGSDEEVMRIYNLGRKWSLDYFDELYKMLGTTFNNFIYESEVSEPGIKIVREFLKKGLFEESEGAIVYKGEQDGLHTRVFINQKGLPTYEAKDLGNYEKKLELLPKASFYVVVTANEQNEYFKVVNTVAKKIHSELEGRLVHIGHGLMRLPEGKMSSREGNVIEAEDLIGTVKEKVKEKMSDLILGDDEKENVIKDIAIGAIKFSILKQAPGKDTIFDIEKSISFEGDSGPYLQYTHARICALLSKAETLGIKRNLSSVGERQVELERAIIIYADIVEKATKELAPQHIVNYLLTLTRAFNSMYGSQMILDINNKESEYYLALANATKEIIAHGLNTLGIASPERM